MRTLILAAWLMLPVAFSIWHYGPGQDRLLLDDAARILAEADGHVRAEEWDQAVAKYDEALKLLPPEKLAQARGIRLESAKAKMLAKQLSTANSELQALVEELKVDAKAEPELLAEARSALANSQYYLTWLMRLEGLPRETWEPEIEAARQTYRLLAEESEKQGDASAAKKNCEDLESTIRLARMELNELQGLPLPSQ